MALHAPLCLLSMSSYFISKFSAKRALAVRENPTSSPLIVPVNTITPEPLLYHVCTFYKHTINQTKSQNLHDWLSPVIRLPVGLRNPRKKERQILSNNDHSNSSIHYQHKNTSLQNNIHVSKGHHDCGSSVRFSQELSGFLITAHQL